MLIILLLVMALSTGGGEMSFWLGEIEGARDGVRATVADPQRRREALRILDEMERTAKDGLAGAERAVADLERVAQRRDASSADYAAAMEPLAERRRHDKARLLDLRFALKQQVTREEWLRIFPAPASTSHHEAAGTP